MNGLLFAHRSPASLAEQMARLAGDRGLAERLGARGYLDSEDGSVPSVEEHVREIEGLYARISRRRDTARVQPRKGPWRITFDTNPDTCNLRCVMCE